MYFLQWLSPTPDEDDEPRGLSPARLGASPRSKITSRRKSVAKSATGCLICAQYLGKVPENMLPAVNYKDTQAKADGAIELLWEKISAAKFDAADIVVVVRSEVLEIVHDTFGMSSIARQNIKSASQGQERPSCFVLCAKHHETNVFCYHVFRAEDPMLVSGSF